MAGLGEACSHIAATLFAVASIVLRRIQDNPTCTSMPCQWTEPSLQTLKKVEYKRGCDIAFIEAKRKKRAEQQQNNIPALSTPAVNNRALSEAQKNELYKALYESEKFEDEKRKSKSAILSIVPAYSDGHIPKQMSRNLPPSMLSLYKPDHSSKRLKDLVALAEETLQSLTISDDHIKAVEEETRDQANNRLWFSVRAGRVTASVFRAATKTNIDRPSESLIKRICYPESYIFMTKATKYGCEHEDKARKTYTCSYKDRHADFDVANAGLFLNSKYPYLGASPDGKVSCVCCGEGILEIKCPYNCIKAESLLEAADDDSFCLKLDGTSGCLLLKRDHPYYYQVQAQLALSEKQYCDFVLFKSEYELHIERIFPDGLFFTNAVAVVREFYIKCILPELLGKWYTLTRHQLNKECHGYCYCGADIVEGDMIECSSGICKIKLFHRKCLNLTNARKSWKCPACSKIMNHEMRENRKKLRVSNKL